MAAQGPSPHASAGITPNVVELQMRSPGGVDSPLQGGGGGVFSQLTVDTSEQGLSNSGGEAAVANNTNPDTIAPPPNRPTREESMPALLPPVDDVEQPQPTAAPSGGDKKSEGSGGAKVAPAGKKDGDDGGGGSGGGGAVSSSNNNNNNNTNATAGTSGTDNGKPGDDGGTKQQEKGAAKGVLEKSAQTAEWLRKALVTPTAQPDDLRVWYWDTLVTLMLLYYGVFIPVQIAVPRESLFLTLWGHFGMECLATIVFCVDIYVRLNTAFFEPGAGKLVDDRKLIFKHYVARGMWRDVVAAVPADLILLVVMGHEFAEGWLYLGVSSVRFLLKIPRFQDFFKVVTPVKLSADAVNYQYSFIPNLKLVFFVVLAINFVAVIWIIVNQEGTARYVSAENRYSYVTSLYWVLYTVTTVGYGDVPVDSSGKRLFACCLFIIGVVVQGIVISKISTRMSKGDVESERVDTMKETLLVLKKFDIPDQLASEVLAFQYHRLHSDMQGGFMQVLESLPGIMKEKVGIFVRMKLICTVQMFKELPAECLVDLAKCLKTDVFEPENDIIQAGQDGNEMYFLGHGFVQVKSSAGDHLAFMKPGQAFGEIALLTDAKRMATIATLTYCELFRLDKGDFWKLIRRHRALRQSVASEVKKRNIEQTNTGTVYMIHAINMFDGLGVVWEEGSTGVLIKEIDEEGAAYRAGLLLGMRLLDVEGYPISSVDDTLELDTIFGEQGYLQVRCLGPSVEDIEDVEKAEEILAGALTPSASTVVSAATHAAALRVAASQQGGTGSPPPANDKLRSPRGSLLEVRDDQSAGSGEGLNSRVPSSCSLNSSMSNSSKVVRASQSVATIASRLLSASSKSPRGTLHLMTRGPSPKNGGGISPGRQNERALQELSARMTKIESRLESSHGVVQRLETMTEGLLNSLGLVVERGDAPHGGVGTPHAGPSDATGDRPPALYPIPSDALASSSASREQLHHALSGASLPIDPPPKELEAAVQSIASHHRLQFPASRGSSARSVDSRKSPPSDPGRAVKPFDAGVRGDGK